MTGLRVYQRDGELPSLAEEPELCVPSLEAVRAWIEAELLVPRGVEPIAEVRLEYARWKPGTSLTCAYSTRFADGVVELVGLKRYADGKERLLAEREPREIPAWDDARLAGHVVRSSDRLALWAAGADRQLAGHALVADGRHLARWLEEGGLAPPRSVRRRRTSRACLRYKPERRALWRIDVSLRDLETAERSFALRVLPRETVPSRLAARRAFEAAGGAVLAPALLLAEERLGVLLEPWLGLVPHGPEDFAHSAETGALLARLHSLAAARPATPPAEAPAEGRADRALEPALFAADPALARAAASWRACAERRVAGWVHGDLHPDQVARETATGRALLLDLDELGLGDPRTDLASWVADRLQSAPGLTLEEAAEDLLAGYEVAGGRRPSLSSLARHVADQLAARAAGALRRLEYGALDKAARDLARALVLAEEPSLSLHPVGVRAERGGAVAHGAPNRAAGAPGMARVQLALDGIAARLGRPLPEEAVERVDVSRDGAIELTVRDAERTRWFRDAAAELHELDPATDERLPLGASLVRDEGARVLAYRPGRRLVLARGDEVVKGYRAGRAADSLRRHELAARATRGRLSVPHAWAGAAGTASVRFARIEGHPLSLAPASVELCFVLGAELAHLQQEGADALPLFGVADELRVLTERAERTRAAGFVLPPGWDEGCARVLADAARLPEPHLGFAHRDLHDGQLLVSGDGLTLLDFDLACRADVALDAANLLAHLALRAHQGLAGATEESAELLGEAFLEGLDRGDEDGFWPRLRFYQTTAFLRLALVYLVRPRWTGLAAPLVLLAQGALRDVERMQPT